MAEQEAVDAGAQTEEVPDNSTQETPETQIPPPENTTENTQESPTETEAKKPEWDKERQRRDEEKAAEKARREKELADEVARLREEVAGLKGTGKAELQQQPDTNAEIITLIDQIEQCEDPFEVNKLSAKKDRLMLQRQQEQDEWRRRQEQREAEAQRESKAKRDWRAKWEKENPNVPVKVGEDLIAEAWQYAEGQNLSGAEALAAANTYYSLKLPSVLEKSKSTKPTGQRQTATQPGSKTPAGTKVTPATTGVRPSANQRGDLAKALTKALAE